MAANKFLTSIFLLLAIAGVFNPIAGVDRSTYPDGYTYFSFMSTAYKVHTERVKWSEAKEICLEEGATLAVIDTDPKVQVIASLKESQTPLWVGISRESRAYPWLAVDGETVVSYLPWAPSEPSCNYNCVAIDNRDRGVGNKNCNVRKSFVCEIAG